MIRTCIAGLGLILLTGCGPATPALTPSPHKLTADAIGHYCNMIVTNHAGPKGQILLHNSSTPRWFASVRDTLTFTILPDEPKNIAAIFVTDLARASWDAPEPDTWIEARKALFVVGSDRIGGMGAPELAPFGDRKIAEQFVAKHGGEIRTFDQLKRMELTQMNTPVIAPVAASPANRARS